MALTVEDGTGLEAADSYISLVDARALALDFGWVLPTDDTEADIALRNGAQYVDLSESSFAGTRLIDVQGLAWPRLNSFKCYGNNTINIDSDSVPKEMQKAQVAAAVEYGEGKEPRPNNDGQEVQEQTVGPITKKFFQSGTTGGGFTITTAIDAMKPLLCSGSGLFSMRTVRG